MTKDELKQARRELGLSLSDMAAALGLAGKHAPQQVRRMESGARPILDRTAERVRQLLNAAPGPDKSH